MNTIETGTCFIYIYIRIFSSVCELKTIRYIGMQNRLIKALKVKLNRSGYYFGLVYH